MKILIVVDMQNDFITGSLGTKEAQAIVPNVVEKVQEYMKNNDLIVFTRDTHFENYSATREGHKLPVEHCIKNTHGWDVCDELKGIMHSYPNCLAMDKYTFGCIHLPTYLMDTYISHLDFDEGVEIELVGLCTDICVVSNALLLKAYLYNNAEISVDATCCAGVTPESHEAALKTMEMCQINVRRN